MIVNLPRIFPNTSQKLSEKSQFEIDATLQPPPPRTGTAFEPICVVTGVKNWSLSLATLQHIPFNFGTTPNYYFYYSDEYGLFIFLLFL